MPIPLGMASGQSHHVDHDLDIRNTDVRAQFPVCARGCVNVAQDAPEPAGNFGRNRAGLVHDLKQGAGFHLHTLNGGKKLAQLSLRPGWPRRDLFQPDQVARKKRRDQRFTVLEVAVERCPTDSGTLADQAKRRAMAVLGKDIFGSIQNSLAPSRRIRPLLSLNRHLDPLTKLCHAIISGQKCPVIHFAAKTDVT